MRVDIREALRELQSFHMALGNANKVAAIESFINDCRNPIWYDYHCVKRAVKEYITFYLHEVKRLHQKGSVQMIKMGTIIHSLEQVCAFINLYRRAERDGGFLGTFDDYFADEEP